MEKKGGDTLSKQRRQISRDKKAWKTMLRAGWKCQTISTHVGQEDEEVQL